MAHWCPFPSCSSGPSHTEGTYRCGGGEHPTWKPETTQSLQFPTPEQGQRSTRMTRARAPLAGDSGHRASPATLPAMGTEPARLPPGHPSLSPGPGPLQSTWRDVTAGLQCRDAALGEQPGTRERIRVHLILFSVFAASCFGENKQSWVCEVIGTDKNSVDSI